MQRNKCRNEWRKIQNANNSLADFSRIVDFCSVRACWCAHGRPRTPSSFIRHWCVCVCVKLGVFESQAIHILASRLEFAFASTLFPFNSLTRWFEDYRKRWGLNPNRLWLGPFRCYIGMSMICVNVIATNVRWISYVRFSRKSSSLMFIWCDSWRMVTKPISRSKPFPKPLHNQSVFFISIFSPLKCNLSLQMQSLTQIDAIIKCKHHIFADRISNDVTENGKSLNNHSTH